MTFFITAVIAGIGTEAVHTLIRAQWELLRFDGQVWSGRLGGVVLLAEFVGPLTFNRCGGSSGSSTGQQAFILSEAVTRGGTEHNPGVAGQ